MRLWLVRILTIVVPLTAAGGIFYFFEDVPSAIGSAWVAALAIALVRGVDLDRFLAIENVQQKISTAAGGLIDVTEKCTVGTVGIEETWHLQVPRVAKDPVTTYDKARVREEDTRALKADVEEKLITFLIIHVLALLLVIALAALRKSLTPQMQQSSAYFLLQGAVAAAPIVYQVGAMLTICSHIRKKNLLI